MSIFLPLEHRICPTPFHIFEEPRNTVWHVARIVSPFRHFQISSKESTAFFESGDVHPSRQALPVEE